MANEDDQSEPCSNELIFGLVAPVGVNLNLVCEVLTETLTERGYETEVNAVRITSLMKEVEIGVPFDGDTYVDQVKNRIRYANTMRAALGNDALAVMAVSAIRKFRKVNNLSTLASQMQTPVEGVHYEEQFLHNQAFTG